MFRDMIDEKDTKSKLVIPIENHNVIIALSARDPTIAKTIIVEIEKVESGEEYEEFDLSNYLFDDMIEIYYQGNKYYLLIFTLLYNPDWTIMQIQKDL